jgi:hypothetical protein
MGILDVLGQAAAGAGEGIETGLSIQSHLEERKRKMVQDALDRKLQEAQIANLNQRRQSAIEADQRADEERGQRDIQAADVLHRYPDIAEQYGTDFRPGGGARANLDAILQAGEERATREEEQRNREEFPEQFVDQARQPTSAQRSNAISRIAATILDTNPLMDPAEAHQQATAIYQQQQQGGADTPPEPTRFTERPAVRGAIQKGVTEIMDSENPDEAIRMLADRMGIRISRDAGVWTVVRGSGSRELEQLMGAILAQITQEPEEIGYFEKLGSGIKNIFGGDEGEARPDSLGRGPI